MPTQKIFAGNALTSPGTQQSIAVLGSTAAGSTVYSVDVDPTFSDTLQGTEWSNGVNSDDFIKNPLPSSITTWSSATTYNTGDYAKDSISDLVYISLVNGNLNNPLTDTAFWQLTGTQFLPFQEALNSVGYVLSSNISEMQSDGVLSFSLTTPYLKDAIVKNPGTEDLYISLYGTTSSPNLGNPLTMTGSWKFYLTGTATTVKQGGVVMAPGSTTNIVPDINLLKFAYGLNPQIVMSSNFTFTQTQVNAVIACVSSITQITLAATTSGSLFISINHQTSQNITLIGQGGIILSQTILYPGDYIIMASDGGTSYKTLSYGNLNSQKIVFYATKPSGFALSAASPYTTFTSYSSQINDNNYFNITTGIWTPPAGRYKFSFGMTYSVGGSGGINGNIAVRLGVSQNNGNPLDVRLSNISGYNTGGSTGGSYINMWGETILSSNGTDTFKLVANTGGASGDVTSIGTLFISFMGQSI